MDEWDRDMVMNGILDAADQFGQDRPWGLPAYLLVLDAVDDAFQVGAFERNPLPRRVNPSKFLTALACSLRTDPHAATMFDTFNLYGVGIIQEGLMLDIGIDMPAIADELTPMRSFLAVDAASREYTVIHRKGGVPIPLPPEQHHTLVGSCFTALHDLMAAVAARKAR